MAHFLIINRYCRNLINYIKNQETHHKKKTFLEEFKEFLKAFEIEYDERYIFKELED
jgi:putative transposase